MGESIKSDRAQDKSRALQSGDESPHSKTAKVELSSLRRTSTPLGDLAQPAELDPLARRHDSCCTSKTRRAGPRCLQGIPPGTPTPPSERRASRPVIPSSS